MRNEWKNDKKKHPFTGGTVTVKDSIPYLRADGFITHILNKNNIFIYDDDEKAAIRERVVKAFSSWESKQMFFDDEAHLVNFVSKTIQRAALNIIAKKQTMKQVFIRDIVPEYIDPEDYVSSNWDYSDIQQAFCDELERRLGKQCVEFLSLKMQGYTIKEAVEMMEWDEQPTVVSKRLKRAYYKFQKNVRKEVQPARLCESQSVSRGVREEKRHRMENQRKETHLCMSKALRILRSIEAIE